MDNFQAVMIAEGAQAPESETQYFEAWQHLIDTGLAWTLQGSFGRKAADLIELGLCHAHNPVEKDKVTKAQDDAVLAAMAIQIYRRSKELNAAEAKQSYLYRWLSPVEQAQV